MPSVAESKKDDEIEKKAFGEPAGVVVIKALASHMVNCSLSTDLVA